MREWMVKMSAITEMVREKKKYFSEPYVDILLKEKKKQEFTDLKIKKDVNQMKD